MDTPIVPSHVRTVYEGRIFTVRVETIQLRTGHTLEAEIVRHPGSVVIIPVTAAGAIVLVRQYRHPLGRWAWELPAGSLKPGENEDEAAVRECHEEIGLVPDAIRRLGAFYPTPGYCDERMHFYRATGLRSPRGDEHAQPDADEDIEQRAFARDELAHMIAQGDVIDLKTIAGLALLDAAGG